VARASLRQGPDPQIYLNRVYLGAGTYGVDVAAHRYFGKSAAKLTCSSAVIAGLVESANPLQPGERADRRWRVPPGVENMVRRDSSARDAGAAESKAAPCRVGRPGSRYFADWVADQICNSPVPAIAT
jgi:penicillin-binding protein 1A